MRKRVENFWGEGNGGADCNYQLWGGGNRSGMGTAQSYVRTGGRTLDQSTQFTAQTMKTGPKNEEFSYK